MWTELKTIFRRATAVMRLDDKAISEIHADPRATYQAAAVVFVSSLAVGVPLRGGLGTTLGTPVGLLVWWLSVAYVVYLVGMVFHRGKDTPPTAFAPIARGIGYAMAPGIFWIFWLFIPSTIIGLFVVVFPSTVWTFTSMASSTHIALGQVSYTRVTIIIGLAMLPYAFAVFLLG